MAMTFAFVSGVPVRSSILSTSASDLRVCKKPRFHPSSSSSTSSLSTTVTVNRRIVASVESPESGSDKPASPNPERPKPPEQTFFGLRLRTNGDVLKFGVIATVIPFGIKYALQAAGTPDLLAGQMTTGFVSVFALLAWISSYVFRVGTKQMTYAQQLRDYEDQVIQKRYEELTEEELAALNEELKEES